MFCLVFGFKLPLLNSTYLAGAIAFALLVIKPQRFSVFWELIKLKYTSVLLLFSLSLAPAAIVIAVLHGTYDFSLATQLMGQFPVLICCLLVCSLIFPSIDDEEKLLKLIITIFVLQSVIIILAFALPSFMSFVQSLQYPESSLKGLGNRNNNVYRGLSISGDLFFGLSACYGLIFIFYSKYLLDKTAIRIKHVLIGLLLIAGNIFVARTGFIALVFALILMLLYKSNQSNFRMIAKILFITICIILVSWFLIPAKFQILIIEYVLPFAFEFLYNFMESNQLETSSTNVLMDMYNIPIDFNTFLFGDGYFSTSNGYYYMKTDSGYLRQILFGGIFYLFFFMIYQYKIFSTNKIRKHLNKKEKYNLLTFTIILSLYFLTIHLKGLTIGFMRMILIISWYYFTFINWKGSCDKKEEKCYE
jgi:hypothetical protein